MFISLQGCALAPGLSPELVPDGALDPGTAEASWDGGGLDAPEAGTGEASSRNPEKPLQEAPDAFEFGMRFLRPR